MSTRDKLLDAAVQLFSQLGVGAVSVGDICERAGVPKGSFYHAWPSKQALLLEAIDRYVEDYNARLRQALDPDLPVVEQLTRVFATLRAVAEERTKAAAGVMPGCTTENLVIELASRDEDARLKLAQVFDGWCHEIGRVLTAGVESGELSIDDPTAASRALLALVQGATILARAHNDPSTVQDIGHTFIALCTGPQRQSTLDAL